MPNFAKHSNRLLELARRAAANSERHHTDAIVAIVFSAMSVEAFTNEIIGEATTLRGESVSPVLASLAEIARATDLDDRLAPLFRKVRGIHLAAAQECDLGRQPWQNVELLFSARNAVAHARVEDLKTVDVVDAAGISTNHQPEPPQIIKRLVSLKVIPKPPIDVLNSTFSLLCDQRAAVWAHNTARACRRGG